MIQLIKNIQHNGKAARGRYPQPMKLSTRVTVWKVSDISQLIVGGEYP